MLVMQCLGLVLVVRVSVLVLRPDVLLTSLDVVTHANDSRGNPGWIFIFLQHREIGHFQTLNRITHKVMDECSQNFWEGYFWIKII